MERILRLIERNPLPLAPRNTTILSACLLLITFGFALFGLSQQWLIGLNNDNNAVAQQARQLLHGWTPYSCTSAANSPGLAWLYAAPVWGSQITGVSVRHTLDLLSAVLIVLSLGLCARLLWRVHTLHILTRTTLLALFSYILIWLPFYAQTYGDADHYLLVLCLPYLLWLALKNNPQAPNNRTQWCIGIMAAAGLFLRPHYYAVLPALIAWQAYDARNMRTIFRTGPTRALLLSTLMIWLLTWLLLPDYLLEAAPAYFRTYHYLRWTTADIARHFHGMYGNAEAFPVLLAFMVLLLFRFRIFSRAFLFTLLLAFTTYCTFFLTAGWAYARLPALAAFVALVGVLMHQSWTAMSTSFLGRYPMLLLAPRLAATLLCAVYLYGVQERLVWPALQMDLRSEQMHGQPANSFTLAEAEQLQFDEALKGITTFGMLSVSTWPSYLAERSGTLHVLRTDFLVTLPGAFIHENNRLDANSEGARCIANSLARDVTSRKPQLLIVDNTPNQRGLHRQSLHFLAYFSKRSEAFKQALLSYRHLGCIWQHKENPAGEQEKWCTYRLLYRIDSDQSSNPKPPADLQLNH